MQITANSTFNAVHQCQVLALAKGDSLSGDIAAYLMRTGSDVSPADDEAQAYFDDLHRVEEPEEELIEPPEEPLAGDEPPAETPPGDAPPVEAPPAEEEAVSATIDVASSKISDVMAWVGNDPARAQAAFEAESAKSADARSTLLDQLTKIIQS